MLTKVIKRKGHVEEFDSKKIEEAIYKSVRASNSKVGLNKIVKIREDVVSAIAERYVTETPSVEAIQDEVERALVHYDLPEAAKKFILYRKRKSDEREGKYLIDVMDLVEGYINNTDWRVRENANSAFSVSGLMFHISGAVAANYSLNKYPKRIGDAHKHADIHIHDLSLGLVAGYSFYRNETVVVMEKATENVYCISLEELFESVDSKIINENDFEIKYTDKYYILDENGWTNLERVLRHKTEKDLISLNTENGRNIIVTVDHPFITLKNEKKEVTCPKCSGYVNKNGIDRSGNQYYKCNQCDNKFKEKIEKIVDEREEKYAEDVKLNDYCICPRPRFISTINHIDPKYGWLIGFFIADGYIKDNYMSFDIKDKTQECKNLLAILKSKKLDYKTYKKSDNRLINIKLSGLPSDIKDMILGIRKYSENKNLPKNSMDYSPHTICSILSGIIDGDGYVRYDDKWVSRVCITLTSKTLLAQIQTHLDRMNINSSYRSIDGFGDRIYNGSIISSKKQLYSMSIYLPKNSMHLFNECLKIDQSKYKCSRPLNKKKYSTFRKIETIKNDSEYVYDVTTQSHTFLCNGILAHNCAGWDLERLFIEGINNIPGKVSSNPANHLTSATWQMINFIGTLQNEWAGAQAFNSVDTLLAPFVRKDKLSYKQVKQAMQGLVFNLNVPSRWANQAPFSNFTFDWQIPQDKIEDIPVIGGKPMNFTYGDLQEESLMITKAFMEVMTEGDAKGSVLTFPVPTINITKQFDWKGPLTDELFELTAKYGPFYFANFVNSELDPADIRSMCCRLSLNMKELKNKMGGLFGAGSQTGSIGVVTINLPKIGYLAKNEKQYFDLLDTQLENAKDSLELKREYVSRNLERGLMPYTMRYLGSFRQHFNTIGIIGMHESLMNFMQCGVWDKTAHAFAIKVMDHIRKRLIEFQEETGNLYNLEATPAEGTTRRLAGTDRKNHSDIIVANNEAVKEGAAPYYTNSIHLPVGYSSDLFETLDLEEELLTKFTGGCVKHIYLGERLTNGDSAKNLVKKVCKNYKIPYISVTPSFSVCPTHGYINGEHDNCPCEK